MVRVILGPLCIMIELRNPVGDTCGAMVLDQTFLDKLTERVGSKRWNKASAADRNKWLADNWEGRLKRGFNGQGSAWDLPLPPACASSSAHLRTLLKRSKGSRIGSKGVVLDV